MVFILLYRSYFEFRSSLSVLVQLPFISVKTPGTNWQEAQTGTWCLAHGLIPAGNTVSGQQNAIVSSLPSVPVVSRCSHHNYRESKIKFFKAK